MQQIDHLLEKFFKNQISVTELQKLHYLLAIHKDELTNQINLNVEELEKEVTHLLNNQKSQELLNAIHIKINIEQTTAKYIPFKKVIYPLLAAASILGIIVLSVQWFNNRGSRSVTADIVKTKPKNTISITNNQVVDKKVVLQDGSMITLEPGAAITYYQPFVTTRDISLTGEATFKVAKDAAKPFSVYANHIVTTALGTTFTVNSNQQSVKVVLIEGRVVVRPADGTFSMNNTYLHPGQQLAINKLTGTYALSNISKKNNNVASSAITGKPAISLAFNKTPLTEVIASIGNRYNILIQFDKEEVKSLSFTGTFTPTDSLQTILTIICNTNDLSYKLDKGIVIISKQ